MKEAAMQAAKQNNKLPEEFANITLFADLSQHIIQQRKTLNSTDKNPKGE